MDDACRNAGSLDVTTGGVDIQIGNLQILFQLHITAGGGDLQGVPCPLGQIDLEIRGQHTVAEQQGTGAVLLTLRDGEQAVLREDAGQFILGELGFGQFHDVDIIILRYAEGDIAAGGLHLHTGNIGGRNGVIIAMLVSVDALGQGLPGGLQTAFYTAGHILQGFFGLLCQTLGGGCDVTGGTLQIVGNLTQIGFQILQISAHLAHQILQSGKGVVGGLAGLLRTAVSLIDKGNHFAQIADARFHLGKGFFGSQTTIQQIGIFGGEIGGDLFYDIVFGGAVHRIAQTGFYQFTQLFVHVFNCLLQQSEPIRQSIICLIRCHSALFS